jgi:DNA invertase Pin-like site-specific DNA recombinase
MTFAYARVSTLKQNFDSQIDFLEKHGYDEIFIDKITGVDFNREGLNLLLSKIRAEDILLVWRLDRLGRSMLEVLKITEKLKKNNVHIVSINDSVDTRTPTGNLMLGLMATFSEYERDLLKERQKAGQLARKRRGLPTGRKKGIAEADKNKVQMVKALFAMEKYTISKIMEMVNIKSKTTFYKYLDLDIEEKDL